MDRRRRATPWLAVMMVGAWIAIVIAEIGIAVALVGPPFFGDIILPASLAIATIVEVARGGISPARLLTAGIAVVTLGMGVLSLGAIAAGSAAGFSGGFMTMLLGVILGIIILSFEISSLVMRTAIAEAE